VLLTEGQRRELLPVVRGDAELLSLDTLIAGLGISVTNDVAGGAVTLSFAKREVSLYRGKSLASVEGDLRLLSSPAHLEDGRWLVPVDAVPRLLGPLLGRRADWRPTARVLIVGNVSVPRITVGTYVSGDVARIVFEASEKVPFRVSQEQGKVTVSVPRDLLDVAFQQQRLTGGIVESVQFVGGRENLFTVSLGRRFKEMKAVEQDQPPRLVLDFQAPPVALPAGATAAEPAAAAPAAPASAPPTAAGVGTVVIDPGHGGDETGATGPGGNFEKDVALAIARKLKAQLVNGLGLQVFLTRERDEAVDLDARTAIANNYKADLFISIHANASRARLAAGSEVYFLSYQADDEETRRVAQAEGMMSSASPGTSDLALILWDMAQAAHLEESSALASRIQEELAVSRGSEGRGVKQAPFRVLVGAAMPAVLVEVAFISNAEEEKLLVSDAFQSKVAAALTKGIARYRQERLAVAAGPTTTRRAP
jgi:N-acetylmuramoyl-L-alanine amidase